MRNKDESISAYEILMKHCSSLKNDKRIVHVLLAMGEYTMLKLKQQRENQKPNIKLVNNANYPNNEFQG